jgi:hypothetical protein
LHRFAATTVTALAGHMFATAHPVLRRLQGRVAKNGQRERENRQRNNQNEAAR